MVTIKDIARKLDISHTTVSMVLNGRAGKYRISEEVARKVRETADELGYVRNAIAHSMTTGCTNTVAFFIRACDMKSEYMLRILNGVLKVVDKYGFSLKIFEWDTCNDQQVIRRLREQHISGVLLHHSSESRLVPYLEEFKRLNIPCCVVNMKNSTGIGGGVFTNDACGVEEAVKYLVSLGHEKISYLTLDAEVNYLCEREKGYLNGMQSTQLSPQVKKVASGSFGSCLDELKRFLTREDDFRPTAVICDSDYRAQELMQAAYQCRIRIPDELSVVGFGGLAPAVFSAVPLTTVEQSFEEIGFASAQMLIRHITEKTPLDGENISLHNQLKIADSTGKPYKNNKIKESDK